MSPHGYTESAGAGQTRARARPRGETEGKGGTPGRGAAAPRVVSADGGEDPDIAGIVPGPQANPWGDGPAPDEPDEDETEEQGCSDGCARVRASSCLNSTPNPYLHLAGLSSTSALDRVGRVLLPRAQQRRVEARRRSRSRARASAAPRQHRRALDAVRRAHASTCSTQRRRWSATARTETTNWCHVTGLQPDTTYTYEVSSTTRSGPRASATTGSRAPIRGWSKAAARYVNQFRTHPAADQSTHGAR